MYSLYRAREIFKILKNNMKNLNKVIKYSKMYTTFINSENSKTCDVRILLINLPDKINLKINDKYVALSSFSIYYV